MRFSLWISTRAILLLSVLPIFHQNLEVFWKKKVMLKPTNRDGESTNFISFQLVWLRRRLKEEGIWSRHDRCREGLVGRRRQHQTAFFMQFNSPHTISNGLYIIIISSLYSHRHQCLSISIPPLSFIPHAWMHALYIHPVVQHACMGSTKHAEKCWSSYIICTYVFSPFSMDSIHSLNIHILICQLLRYFCYPLNK